MICPYCGYEYDDKEHKCPFCATDNTGVAREQQRAVIRTLEQESQNIEQNMPGELLHRASKKTTGIFAKIFLAFLILVIGVIAGSAVFRVYRSYATERSLQKLEEYMVSGDYEALLKYMDGLDSYDSVYDKYTEVSYAYRYLSYAQEELEWFYEDRENPYSDSELLLTSLSFTIGDCLNTLSYCTEYMDDQLILENEDTLYEIRLLAYNILTMTLHLSDEEITELLALESYYDIDPIMPYAKLSLERME